MVGILKKLFGSGEGSPVRKSAPPESYNGFLILAQPVKSGSQWNIAGVIKSEDESDEREHRFIRADTYMSEEDAVRFTIIKAKQIIDERKTSLLDSD